jgi:lipid-binding SYLF domain-containing protein
MVQTVLELICGRKAMSAVESILAVPAQPSAAAWADTPSRSPFARARGSRRGRLSAAWSCFAALALALNLAQAQQTDSASEPRRQEIDASAQATLERLFDEREAARGLYDRAAGYAVFAATKAGFLVTGGGGTGVAVDKTTGARTYMRMGTGGIGLGIGAQRYDLVILFEDVARLSRFIQGGWDASASAQAAAGTDGVSLSSSFIDGIAFFQLTDKGLMAQADVSGTRFWVIDGLN